LVTIAALFRAPKLQSEAFSPFLEANDEAGAEGLQGVVGVAAGRELAGAVLGADGDVGEDGEVGAELELIGEGGCAIGAGSVVGAYGADLGLEVGVEGEQGDAAGVDACADEAAEDLVAVGGGVGAVLDDGAEVCAEARGAEVDEVVVEADGAAEGGHTAALVGARAVAYAEAGVVAGAEHGVGGDLRCGRVVCVGEDDDDCEEERVADRTVCMAHHCKNPPFKA